MNRRSGERERTEARIIAAVRAHTAFYGYPPDAFDVSARLRLEPDTVRKHVSRMVSAGRLRRVALTRLAVVEEAP